MRRSISRLLIVLIGALTSSSLSSIKPGLSASPPFSSPSLSILIFKSFPFPAGLFPSLSFAPGLFGPGDFTSSSLSVGLILSLRPPSAPLAPAPDCYALFSPSVPPFSPLLIFHDFSFFFFSPLGGFELLSLAWGLSWPSLSPPPRS